MCRLHDRHGSQAQARRLPDSVGLAAASWPCDHGLPEGCLAHAGPGTRGTPRGHGPPTAAAPPRPPPPNTLSRDELLVGESKADFAVTTSQQTRQSLTWEGERKLTEARGAETPLLSAADHT